MQIFHLVWILVVFALAVFVSSAVADLGPSETQQEAADRAASVMEGIQTGGTIPHFGSQTDPGAADGVDLRGADRDEAIELLSGVFGKALNASTPDQEDLEGAKFITPTVAVLAPDRAGETRSAALVESSVPLASDLASGTPEPVNLELQRTDGSLEPVNPAVPVSVPTRLGEGIEFPESEVGIKLQGSPGDRAASTAGELGAFYPEVGTDADLLVSPTPTGVETDIQLRSAAAPKSETYTLALPPGATMHETAEGGVEAEVEGEPMMDVPRPTAIDANGVSLPTELELSGQTITVSVSVGSEAAYPVLVDPVYEMWAWKQLHTTGGIYHYPGESPFKHGELENFYSTAQGEGWSPEVVMPAGTSGLSNNEDSLHGSSGDGLLAWGATGSGTVVPGDRAWWVYSVPNYWADHEKGTAPETYIESLKFWELNWQTFSPYESAYWSPYLLMGIARADYSWESVIAEPSKQGYGFPYEPGHIYEFNGQDPDAKLGIIGLGWGETEPANQNSGRVFTGVSTVALNEPATSVPTVGSLGGPSQWMNTTPLPLNFRLGDHGLGLYGVRTTPEQYIGTSQPTWDTLRSCSDYPGSACPEVWASTEPGVPNISYDPTKMPTGIDRLNIFAFDLLSHGSAMAHAAVKIDHTAPTVLLSGSATEEASLGPKRPTYSVTAVASDGSAAAPQSGINSETIEFDSKVVATSTPHCTSENCGATMSWTLHSNEVTAGTHTIKIVAEDAVGNKTTKTISLPVQPSAPEVALSGSMTEQAVRGSSQPQYRLVTKAVGTAGSSKAGSVLIEVSADGKLVSTSSQSCATERCEKTNEYVLHASEFHSEGTHTVAIKATDMLGNVTTRLVAVTLTPDNVPPTLTSSGPLVNAPEGWVEQDIYNLSASSTDAGAGATSLSLKIDGATLASSTGACVEGGCELSLTKAVNMAPFSGGSHHAEIVAVDGAGNSRSKSWTINVDPEGHIGPAELQDTLEAVELTSESEVIASNQELMEQSGGEEGAYPVVHESIGRMVTSGTPDIVELSEEAGFKVGLPESTMAVDPIGVAESALPAEAVEESVVIAGDTSSSVDTIVRPVFDGIMAFQNIRDASAPREFSWEVELWPGQTLHLIDTKTAEVELADGSEAFLISAELAHDVVGTSVPSTLSVEGNILTLHVEDQASNLVFPVMAGTGWYGGLTTEYPTPPLNELQIREREERREREEEEARKAAEEATAEEPEASPESEGPSWGWLGAPVPVSTTPEEEGAATGSSGTRHAPLEREYGFARCGPSLPLFSGCNEYEGELWGSFRFNGVSAWWPPSRKPHPHCDRNVHLGTSSLEFCDWIGNSPQPYGGGRHISSQMRAYWSPFGIPSEVPMPVTEYMYGDGYANGHKTASLCNPLSTCP
jgi:hypothetical protein